MIKKGIYTILEYPELELPDLLKVRVVGVYDNPKLGKIVCYKYNWPFPITKEAKLKEFESWIAVEREV